MAVDGLARQLSGLIARSAAGASERELIDHTVTGVTELLPVSGAGATLTAVGELPALIAASDSATFALEQLQTRLREGPCLIAHRERQVCLAPDVAADARFRNYGPAASRAGASGVFAFPLICGDDLVGVVDLYVSTGGGLTGDQVAVARMLCDAAAAFVVNARTRGGLECLAARLSEAAGREPAQITGAGEASSRTWDECWIDGMTPNGGAFAHVVCSPLGDGLLVTELDARALIVMRHEWSRLSQDDPCSPGRFELLVTDWDGAQLDRAVVDRPPRPPQDLAELSEVLLTRRPDPDG